ncbi:MAG: DUF1902 domain-containing protein [Gammaproteobacteria bacterium]|nr:DUF1902 domain-containing protein [Gammaproteobacteria bacterium]
MQKRQFNIDVIHTVNDDVWVATSEDIRGLVVESAGFQTFLSDLLEVSVELLAHNHGATEQELNETRLACQVTHRMEGSLENVDLMPEIHISQLHLAAA